MFSVTRFVAIFAKLGNFLMQKIIYFYQKDAIGQILTK